KSIQRDFWPLLKKQPLASRAGTHSLLVAPPDGAEKEKTKMSNEIAVQKEAGNGKSMVSWVALLNEAVTKPGFIHEAYSRFHNYSLGNPPGAISVPGARHPARPLGHLST